jgi:hypothetical protein
MAVRSLNPIELAEIQAVFGAGLNLDRARIREETSIGNWVGTIGAWLRGRQPPTGNAITVGNTSYFPGTLVTPNTNDPMWLTHMGWLMHELTHQWQYQRYGFIYLFQAMFAPTYVYEAAGQRPSAAIKELSEKGKKFSDFNREQQGDIVRDYYFALKQNEDVSGWDTYLIELRTPAK